MAAILFVIEAHGKIPLFQRLFEKIRIDADVVATRGHLYRMPDALNPLGIDDSYTESLREPVFPLILDRLHRLRDRYAHVIIATDPDQEGDAIAADVADIFHDHSLTRIRLHTLDAASLKAAIKNGEPLDHRQAWPATSRRIFDRIIGASFTDVDPDRTNGHFVGRVQSAMLGLAINFPQTYAHLHLYLPDPRKTGQDYISTYAVNFNNKTIAHQADQDYRVNKKIDPKSFQVARIEVFDEVIDRPWNFAECVINVSKAMDCPIRQSADAMQRLYESGKLSYIRSSARTLGSEALDLITKAARNHGIREFDRSQIAKRTESDTHEAPRPLVMVDISIPLRLLPFDDAVLAVITRNLIKSGMKARLERAIMKPGNGDSISCIPMNWKKVKYHGLPWKEKTPPPGIELMRRDVAILAMMNQYELGRPSTQVEHADRFLAKRLVDVDLKANDKALSIAHHTPKPFLSPQTSRAIEYAIETYADRPPSDVVPMLMDSLGSKIGGRMLEIIENQQPSRKGIS